MTDQTFPRIDGYKLLRVIGQGGMSTVYLAEQVSLDRKVALKVMLPDALTDGTNRARFENETRTIARLEHPGIVRIHEVGHTPENLLFYSMPYLSHGHLAQRKLAGDQPKITAILSQLLQALDYAHVRGVVHRDVKAENVLFDEADRPLLTDFGIALRRGSNPRLTNAGLAVGSTAYMPPEQARGQEVDRRADLYSMGVLTWEMLVGRLPYNAGDALTMAIRHVQEPIPRLPSVLKHWQPFIDKAMAKQPGDRFASAQEMLSALVQLEKQSGKAFAAVEVPAAFDASAQATSRATADTSRRRGLWLAAAGVVLLAALGAAYYLHLANQSTAAVIQPAAVAATQPATGLPAPTSSPASSSPVLALPATDRTDASIAAFVANAEEQLRTGQLLEPRNGNAWDSIEAAWHVAPTHPQTLRLTALLFDALGDRAERALHNGDTVTAKLAFTRAQTLDNRRGGTGTAISLLHARLDKALDERLTVQLAKPETRKTAQILLDQVAWLGLDPARKRNLQARISAAQNGPASASAQVTAAAAPVATTPVSIITVSRSDYARFATATARDAADCGKGFLGRSLRWNNTGNDRKPVVCVNAADAQAYARWLQAQDGHHYRLPSAGELRAQPTTPVAGWLSLCADHACTQRMTSGKLQALDSVRGYDNVGIRLAKLD
ncbi:MAG TPA: bifunctional serine/threonine-protein kinase/formylglycine-generating enzyme family protein [Thermomonas sp.]|uniref:serine/threonine-protein kinase n=1 Tax=Thermomonas sp. TaxID=1971895 RepID=UPI002BC953D5|nr:bifunctional serine/threonine-protein kinase/formylglycine-generating enzyme family protein [Thermomonas sp.]HQA01552.1 bifunctional serine/threonine-protein kinase/formylglycine-generating enzyme family protein [Thermomonas sp.]